MTQIIKTTIIIAEDHKLFGLGISQLLESNGQYEIIQNVENGKLLVDYYSQTRADIILSDINLPLLSGLDAALQIRTINPEQKIIFVSMYFDETIASFCRKNKINGFLKKDSTAEELFEGLEQVLNGQYVYPKVSETKTNEAIHDIKDKQFLLKLKLSSREVEIIQLIKKGLTSKQIAERLFLSEYTIETHRKNIFRKLGVTSLVELITFANNNGL